MAKLPVMERFYTLQGEGKKAGQAAFFIRLAGCDVGCVWCDVKESWEIQDDQWIEIEELLKEAQSYPCKLVVVTGGEPAMHDLSAFSQLFHQHGFTLAMETSGAYEIKGQFDWICVSPKKFKLPLPETLAIADEYKQVVFHKSDIDWTQQWLPYLKPNCELLVQAEWDKKLSIYPLLIEYVKENPQWSISVQTHKYLNIP